MKQAIIIHIEESGPNWKWKVSHGDKGAWTQFAAGEEPSHDAAVTYAVLAAQEQLSGAEA